MSKRRKTMTYFLKEDYEIYDSLPCSAVVFSVDDNYKIYYTNDTYNNGNFNQDNIIVEEECRKLFDDTIRSADTPKRLHFKSKNLSGDSIYICMFAVKLDDKHIFALLFDDSENKKKFIQTYPLDINTCRVFPSISDCRIAAKGTTL